MYIYFVTFAYTKAYKITIYIYIYIYILNLYVNNEHNILIMEKEVGLVKSAKL